MIYLSQKYFEAYLTSNLENLGNSIKISISLDDDGFIGRECPNPECEGYFKVKFGTGLKGENLPCYCPYCGHMSSHDLFWTKEQIEYIRSFMLRKVNDTLYKDLKKLEFDHKPRGTFGIGVSLKIKRNGLTPIHYYREKRLETEVICRNCTLHYSIYGVFAFCPDCGQHNSLDILTKNLEIIEKMLDLAADAGKEVADKLIENALEDCVSSFDGFGRETCRINAQRAKIPTKAEKISFQNLGAVKNTLRDIFGFDIASELTVEEWRKVVCGFQKRHLLSHKMGIVDDEYIMKSGDSNAIIGRKVNISPEEVREIIQIISKLAKYIITKVKEPRSSE